MDRVLRSLVLSVANKHEVSCDRANRWPNAFFPDTGVIASGAKSSTDLDVILYFLDVVEDPDPSVYNDSFKLFTGYFF